MFYELKNLRKDNEEILRALKSRTVTDKLGPITPLPDFYPIHDTQSLFQADDWLNEDLNRKNFVSYSKDHIE
jgi:hypothetical protein